jgi:hypothetical protein
MKLAKERVAHLAQSISTHLQQTGYLELRGSKPLLLDLLNRTMTEELQVEDRLNAEVRALMKRYENEIERGGADYQKMFTMIKSKLVKERGLIL